MGGRRIVRDADACRRQATPALDCSALRKEPSPGASIVVEQLVALRLSKSKSRSCSFVCPPWLFVRPVLLREGYDDEVGGGWTLKGKLLLHKFCSRPREPQPNPEKLSFLSSNVVPRSTWNTNDAPLRRYSYKQSAERLLFRLQSHGPSLSVDMV